MQDVFGFTLSVHTSPSVLEDTFDFLVFSPNVIITAQNKTRLNLFAFILFDNFINFPSKLILTNNLLAAIIWRMNLSYRKNLKYAFV